MKSLFLSPVFLLLTILLGFAATGYAQELVPYQLSLEKAVELGLQNHFRIMSKNCKVHSGQLINSVKFF